MVFVHLSGYVIARPSISTIWTRRISIFALMPVNESYCRMLDAHFPGASFIAPAAQVSTRPQAAATPSLTANTMPRRGPSVKVDGGNGVVHSAISLLSTSWIKGSPPAMG